MPYNEKETLVGGQPTGDLTKSGNPNHNSDGQFTSSGNNDSQEDKWDEGEFAGLDFDFDENFNFDGKISGLEDEEIYEKIKEIHNNLVDGETSNILSLIDKKDKKQGLINNVFYDENKIKNATDEEIELLFLIEHLKAKEKDNLNEQNELKKETFSGIWKYKDVNVEDYLDKINSIPLKREYYEKLLDGIKQEIEEHPEYAEAKKDEYESRLNFAQSKLDQLNKFEQLGQKYEKLRDEYFSLKTSELRKELNGISEKFRSSDNPYSEERKNNAIWFDGDNVQEKANKYFKNETMQHFSSMSQEEIASLYLYTSGSSRFNEPLRHQNYSGGKSYNSDFVTDVNNMTNAIDKCTWKDDIWVQRGIDIHTMFLKTPGSLESKDICYLSDDELQALVGSTIEDTGFFSAGAGKGTGFNNSRILLNTYCPRGTKMAYVDFHSAYKGENEMILQRGYSYKITKVEKKKEPWGEYQYYVDMEVILGSDENKFTSEELNNIQKQYVKSSSSTWW